MSSKVTQPTKVNEVSIAKMQVEAIDKINSLIVGLNQVPDVLNGIKLQAEEFKKGLAYDLKVAEVEYNEKIAGLKSKFDLESENQKSELAKLAEDLKVAEKRHKESLEDLKYSNSILIRDENRNAADKLALSLGLELVDKTELKALRSNQITEEVIRKIKQDEFDSYSKELSVKSEEIDTKVRYESGLRISLLEKELEMTKQQLAEKTAIISSQNDLIKNHGVDIREALNAAKANINLPTSENKR